MVACTRASVSSRLSGRLAELLVEEESRVPRGQVMARLDIEEYAAALAQRDRLARDLVRVGELVGRNLEPVGSAEDLEAQLQAATARVGVQ